MSNEILNNLDSFESVLRNKMNDEKPTTGIYKATVTSDVYQKDGKSYIIVDLGKKKDYILYAEEFETVPNKGSIIEVAIVNHSSGSYGVVSHLKANKQYKINDAQNLMRSGQVLQAKIKAKLKKGYEVTIENIDLPCRLFSNREYAVGDTVPVTINDISNNTVYVQTSQLYLRKIVKCKVKKFASVAYIVDILNDKGENVIKNDRIECVIPCTDIAEKPAFEARSMINIGDEIEAQIIAISDTRIILSKVSILKQKQYELAQNFLKGQVIEAKIDRVTSDKYYLTTMSKGGIECEMDIKEVAWSVAQRERVRKSNALEVGNIVQVEVLGIDGRNAVIIVSYKLCNLESPMILFMDEINESTGQKWKVGDIITVEPTFDINTQLNRPFLYFNYKEVDIIVKSWSYADEAALKANKSAQVILTFIRDDISSPLRIEGSLINASNREFNEISQQFNKDGIYKCVIEKRNRMEYEIKPIAYMINGETIDINVPAYDEKSGKPFFILRSYDTASQMAEGQICTCKLKYVDARSKQMYMSVDAYNVEQNRKVEKEQGFTINYGIDFK